MDTPYYYFCRNDWLAQDEEIQVKKPLYYEGVLILGHAGLHATPTILGALKYASGTTLCIVKLDEEHILKGWDMVCSKSREVLFMRNIWRELVNFTNFCAWRLEYLEAQCKRTPYYVNALRDAIATVYASRRQQIAYTRAHSPVSDGYKSTGAYVAHSAHVAATHTAASYASYGSALNFERAVQEAWLQNAVKGMLE